MADQTIDLATTAVFLDFDGTISVRDVGLVLLEETGDGAWRAHSDAFRRGEIGSRACMSLEWSCLPLDRARLAGIASSVDLDPDVGRLVGGLRQRGAEVTVVSDGFGFYVADLLAAAGLGDVEILTNEVDWDEGELRFPNEDRCCPCTTCGTCKQAPIRDSAALGRTTVFVGDGPSDRKAALLADVLYATGDLAEWADRNGIPFRFFRDLGDVADDLFGR